MFQVALPPLSMGEEKRLQPGDQQAGHGGQAGLVQYQGQGYNEGFYQQQQQWLGDYNNHMSYHYNHGHHHQPQYHNQYNILGQLKVSQSVRISDLAKHKIFWKKLITTEQIPIFHSMLHCKMYDLFFVLTKQGLHIGRSAY